MSAAPVQDLHSFSLLARHVQVVEPGQPDADTLAPGRCGNLKDAIRSRVLDPDVAGTQQGRQGQAQIQAERRVQRKPTIGRIIGLKRAERVIASQLARRSKLDIGRVPETA